VLEIADYRKNVKRFAAVAEYHSMPFQLFGLGEPQRVQTGVVSDNYFTLLGVTPIIGRGFLPGEEAGYTGKLFEYLGAGRPIIAVGPEGSVIKDLLEEVGDCWYASTIEQMRSVVRAFHRRWQANGELVIQREKIEQFTARNLAKRFSEILDQITQRAATP